jgi:hypothetical protein
MRAETTRSVPGSSSAGRARIMPCRRMYSIVPWRPAASQSSSRCSSSGRATAATPIFWKPSSRPQALICAASAPQSMGRCRVGREWTVAASIMAAMQPPSSALYTAAQVRDFDRVAIHELGIPG